MIMIIDILFLTGAFIVFSFSVFILAKYFADYVFPIDFDDLED